MKKVFIACAALCALAPLAAQAAHPHKQHIAPLYSTASTPIGTLLDDPRARVIVDRHIPNTSTDRRIYFARKMTLKALQKFANGQISDHQLAAVDTDLAKLKR